MDMIVAYDIADPRRLNRVAKVIKDYGTRVQKSIFEVNVDDKRFIEMKRRAETEMELEEVINHLLQDHKIKMPETGIEEIRQKSVESSLRHPGCLL